MLFFITNTIGVIEFIQLLFNSIVTNDLYVTMTYKCKILWNNIGILLRTVESDGQNPVNLCIFFLKKKKYFYILYLLFFY